MNPASEGGGGARSPRTPWLWIILGVIGLLLLFFLVVLLLFEEDTAGPEAGVTVAEIVENPEPFVGQRVTVSSEVEEVISTSAFTLDSPTAIGNRLLVIRITPGEVTVIEGVPVQVTGTVREFELPAIEEEVGVALDDEAFTEFEGRPAIVAQSISPLGLR